MDKTPQTPQTPQPVFGKQPAQTWLDEIIERHDNVPAPPDSAADQAEEDGSVILYADELGPVGAWDALDVAGLEWITNAYADQSRLITEIERLKSNYSVALKILDENINHYGMTLPQRQRQLLNELRARLQGLK